MDRLNATNTSWRSRTIAIVGAGFSGTALAIQLLRHPPPWPCRIVIVERSGRFGCGLAYGTHLPRAVLNVPAGRMSLEEQRPGDFLDYLATRGIGPTPEDFVQRAWYGDYLETRLSEAAVAAPARVQLVRMSGTVRSVSRSRDNGFWQVELEDGRSVLADATVLALGNFAPRVLDALRPIANSGLYLNDPWGVGESSREADRVLLVGTGLTMADIACELAADSRGPREIIAVSRRGLLSRSRRETMPVAPGASLDFSSLETAGTLREFVSRVRSVMGEAERRHIDWRDVMVVLRERVPAFWHGLSPGDRRRFLRHVQPYWDVHRHQLPPQVGRRVHELITQGRLRILAGRIQSSRVVAGKAVVGLRPRGGSFDESQTFDRVINCSGPGADPYLVDSAPVRSMLAAGHLAPDPTGIGIEVDGHGRLIGRDGLAQRGLYYLGPWLRARDLEATAVHELRRHAAALAERLRNGTDWAATTAVA